MLSFFLGVRSSLRSVTISMPTSIFLIPYPVLSTVLRLVNSGRVSPYLHQIAKDLPAILTRTAGRFVEDKFIYCSTVLYSIHPNGSFIRVRLLCRDKIYLYLIKPRSNDTNRQLSRRSLVTAVRYDSVLLPTWWDRSYRGVQEGKFSRFLYTFCPCSCLMNPFTTHQLHN